MWWARLDLVVLCVWASGVLCCADRRAKIDQETFTSQKTSSGPAERSSTHFIYPRTGRLFHADYVRDNAIFRSLERTNFMRRGIFAEKASLERQTRTHKADENVKKHVYIGDGRIPVEAKKEASVKEKHNPLNSVLFKVSKVVVKDPILKKRVKRDSVPDETTKDGATATNSNTSDTSILNKENTFQTNSSDNISNANHEGGVISGTENKVDCDSVSSVKNNDTDKTLFVHDSTSREPLDGEPSVEIPGVEVDSSGLMKKTVVDDSLTLYPVYRGVKYYYPQTERRLVYSPQLTVQMDVPLVSETEDEANSTTELQDEGRSRRPFKKLAFPLLLALKLKTAIMVPLILGLIGLISFKGLWSGLTALAIAAALGLKALVAGGGAKVLVHTLPPPPPPAHVHHLPPPAVEYAEYWSRRNDDHHNTYTYSDYRPSSWS